jgi:catechol 2,3-dioxygenase-like lactoylglutathione lyase family enzyme
VTERPVFIDHLTIRVRDLGRSRAFYAAALAPLGATVIEYANPPDDPGVIIGPPGAEDLGLVEGTPTAPVHLAFLAPDRGAVDAFHAAALAAGGTDNGAPGLRPRYHAGYYAAFVLDPDGNNVEAVLHER